MTSEVDERGYYKLDKHALVTVELCDIREQHLENWKAGNILQALIITDLEDGFRVNLDATYGVDGYFVAGSLRIYVEPWG